MKISEQKIKEFQKLYERKFGVVLSAQEALEIATRFLRLVEVVESNSSKV